MAYAYRQAGRDIFRQRSRSKMDQDLSDTLILTAIRDALDYVEKDLRGQNHP